MTDPAMSILALMQMSSRMKDYYDISYLSGRFDFEGKNLCEAIRKIFENRDLESNLY